MLCRLVLGRPQAVTAVAAHLRKPDLPSEDTAVVVLTYPRALGVLEASWNQIGGEPALAMVVYGDRGTVLVHQPRATREGERNGGGGGHGRAREGRRFHVRLPGTAVATTRPLSVSTDVR